MNDNRFTNYFLLILTILLPIVSFGGNREHVNLQFCAYENHSRVQQPPYCSSSVKKQVDFLHVFSLPYEQSTAINQKVLINNTVNKSRLSVNEGRGLLALNWLFILMALTGGIPIVAFFLRTGQKSYSGPIQCINV